MKNKEKKILSEKETRKRILNTAKRLGCEKDVMQIFDKYDRALKNCTNEQERKHIAICGAAELHNFFYCKGNLVVNGKEIIPADTTDDVLIK